MHDFEHTIESQPKTLTFLAVFAIYFTFRNNGRCDAAAGLCDLVNGYKKTVEELQMRCREEADDLPLLPLVQVLLLNTSKRKKS